MSKAVLTFAIFSLALNSFSNDFINEKDFVLKYINGDTSIISDFDRTSNELANRFGISYYRIPHKVLADKTFESEKLSGISLDNFSFIELDNDYSVAKLELNNISTDFYFYEGKYIPEIFYKTREYKTEDTKFLRIYYKENDSLNLNAKNKLDEFISAAIETFCLQNESENLEREKLYYVYAGSQDEVERLIGVKSRGIFLISSDVVVSAYPCHFHEICHFLINLRIKEDLKPAFPLFLEGFAVAFGGRGGIDRNVEISTGEFLLRSGFADINDVLTFNRFYENDLSISYSVSAYLVSSVYHKYGFEKLLSYYENYSDVYENLYTVKIDPDIFDVEYTLPEIIQPLDMFSKIGEIIFEENGLKISQVASGYFFSISKNVVLMNDGTLNKTSKIFEDKFPTLEYSSERYLIECDENSIKLYDLHTEELLAMYSNGFSLKQIELKINGQFYFYVAGNVFDGDVSLYKIKLH